MAQRQLSLQEIILTESMTLARNRTLAELQQFRSDPTSVIPALKERLTRYRRHQGSLYLFSKVHRKKALEVNQGNGDERVKEVIGMLERLGRPLGKITTIPKLDEIASKLCQTIELQMTSQITFKPNSSQILRETLNKDSKWLFPNSVICLVSLSFDEPYEPLMTLLVDDGLPERPNCRALMDGAMRFVGVASVVGARESELRCTVFVGTDGVVERTGMSVPMPMTMSGQLPVQGQIPQPVQPQQHIYQQPQPLSSSQHQPQPLAQQQSQQIQQPQNFQPQPQPQPTILQQKQSLLSQQSHNFQSSINSKLSKPESKDSAFFLQPNQIPQQTASHSNYYNEHLEQVPPQAGQRPVTFNQRMVGNTVPIHMENGMNGVHGPIDSHYQAPEISMRKQPSIESRVNQANRTLESKVAHFDQPHPEDLSLSKIF